MGDCPFVIVWRSYLTLVIFFTLTSTLSDINIDTLFNSCLHDINFFHFFSQFIHIVLFEMKFFWESHGWVKLFNPPFHICSSITEFKFNLNLPSTFNTIIDILGLVYYLIFFPVFTPCFKFCFFLFCCELNEHFLDSILIFYRVFVYIYIYILDQSIGRWIKNIFSYCLQNSVISMTS